MFMLFLQGDGTSGPLGGKAATSWLNERGFMTGKLVKTSIIPEEATYFNSDAPIDVKRAPLC